MGYYIDKGMPALGKAEALVAKYGAIVLRSAVEAAEWQKNGFGIVCVINNGPFEAAGYAFSSEELEEFSNRMDLRHKEYLAMDKALAEKLAGYSP